MTSQNLDILRSRQSCYFLLSRVTSDPLLPGWDPLLDPAVQQEIETAGELQRRIAGHQDESLAPGEIDPAAFAPSDLLDLLSEHGIQGVQTEHKALFGLLTPKDCPPYETDYCPQTFSVYRSQHMADIAGYYRAFGVAPSSEKPERADHISLELEFMGWLVGKEALASEEGDGEHVSVCREAQRSFLEKHLCWWTPAFAKALRNKAEACAQPCPFYDALSQSLAAFIAAERRVLEIPPPDRLVAPNPGEDPGAMACGDCVSEFTGQGVFSNP